MKLRSVVLAALIVAGCVGPAAGDPAATTSPATASPIAMLSAAPTATSAPTPKGSPGHTPRPTPSHGMGVRRDAVVAAVEAALGPSGIEWHPERIAKDGTPVLEGGTPSGRDGLVFVSIIGPADDIWGVQSADRPARTVADAALALAILRATAPGAETWFRASFGETPTEPSPFTKVGDLSVGWARELVLFDGHISYLAVSVIDLAPAPTPTPRPTPVPTPEIEPIRLLPMTVTGVTMRGVQAGIDGLPDDFPTCQPLCRREVVAFAKHLGVEPSDLDVAIDRPLSDPSFPVSVAVIRVHRKEPTILFGQWVDTVTTFWPDRVLKADTSNPDIVIVLRRDRTRIGGSQPAWYLRSKSDLLVVVSDAAAGSIDSAPSAAVLDALRQLP